MRVIVKGEDALSTLRFRLGRGLRRQLAGALSLDLSGPELGRLAADGGIAHISGDLPVVADMAITNQVTRADKVWAGTRGLLGLLSQPGAQAAASASPSSTRASPMTPRSAGAWSHGSTSCRRSRASRAIRSATARTSRESCAAARSARAATRRLDRVGGQPRRNRRRDAQGHSLAAADRGPI